MPTTLAATELRGGEFLLRPSDPQTPRFPEDFSEDQDLIRQTVQDFIDTRVRPNLDRIDQLDLEFSRQLLTELGELGIIGIPFPEAYGGSNMDFVTSMLLSELFAQTHSFSTTFNAHTGIGMLPILYFGTPEQKQRYLPELVRGERVAAYCLTEPGSGSDALAAKSQAQLSEDGQHYLLRGQKMWITNAGMADVFIVFAKIDGQHFTGFIVEREWAGISFGEEERKMGIKGSSTRQVFFENVKVPRENLLGEIGKGHKIAFNILNIGRIKLAVGAVGGSKEAADHSIRYALERRQFGQPIAQFGAIQHKLAEQATRIFVVESASYRAAQQIATRKEQLLAEGHSLATALLGAAEAFSIECALLKVQGSECLDYAVDEGVQIFGGMGYSEEAPMAVLYRDSRINRIFEGTNEINRMLSVDRLIKRSLQGELDLKAALQSMEKASPLGTEVPYAEEKNQLWALKKAFLLLLLHSLQRKGQKMAQEQELLIYLSDWIADVYLAESALLRTEKRQQNEGPAAAEAFLELSQTYLQESLDRCWYRSRRLIAALTVGTAAATLEDRINAILRFPARDVTALRRRIAARLLKAEKYAF
ncbi:MAG: acyl-CoA dehydrogenase family protein [Bacteroidota bacterium]